MRNGLKTKVFYFLTNFYFLIFLYMENSIFIGSLLWPLMVVLWLWLLINTSIYQKLVKDFLKEPLALFISSVWWFIIWLLMVKTHNLWEWSWIVLITIMSWLILIKSTLLLLFPEFFESIVKKCKFPNRLIQFAWIVYLLIWAFVVYKSMM